MAIIVYPPYDFGVSNPRMGSRVAVQTHEVPTGAADPVQQPGEGGGVTRARWGDGSTPMKSPSGLGKKHP